MKHNSFPKHKLPDKENINQLVQFFKNVVKFQGDKLLRLVVAMGKNQVQFVEISTLCKTWQFEQKEGRTC